MTATLRSCRTCGGALDPILSLGTLAVSTFPAPDAAPPPRAPLDLCVCGSCNLVQLRHTVDPDLVYREYWYRSGINEAMRAELASIVDTALAYTGVLRDPDLILDVGANDGTLLKEYRKHAHTAHTPRIAFEPARNLKADLRPVCEVLIEDYFPIGLRQIAGAAGRVKILTSIACFYDLDDPRAFVEAVSDLLHRDGVWIVQFQDLAQMLAATAFDNLCHEHLIYYSLASFERLIEQYGLVVVDASHRAINGGSLRLVVRHRTPHGLAVTPRVQALRARERGCDSWQALETFAWRVGEARTQIGAVVERLLRVGKTIDLYAASTKANTLLQYCGFGADEIRQAWERTAEKVGRTTVTGIPIVSEAAGRADPPEALLIGAWQFRDVFVEREAEFLEQGGSMVVPLPHCEIVTAAAGQGGRRAG